MKRNRENNDLLQEEPETKKCKFDFDELIKELSVISKIKTNKLNTKHIKTIKQDLNNLYCCKIFK